MSDSKQLLEVYTQLKKILRENFEDSSSHKVVGAAEEIKQSEYAKFMMFDGGYSSVITSETFKFYASEKYTYQRGDEVTIHEGSLQAMKKCLNTLKKSLT